MKADTNGKMKLYRVAQITQNQEPLYACPWCKWVLFGAEYTLKHMEKCIAQPEACGCATCGNKEMDVDGVWVCLNGVVEGKLFGKDGNAVIHCSEHAECNGEDGSVYTVEMKKGAEFVPMNFSKGYMVLGVEELDDPSV